MQKNFLLFVVCVMKICIIRYSDEIVRLARSAFKSR